MRCKLLQKFLVKNLQIEVKMFKLTIPSSPNWYESDIMACTPDNTLLYGSGRDLVIIKPTPTGPDDVRVIAKAHFVRITSVNINRNYGAPHKYAVTVSTDRIIKLWDVETLMKKTSHNKHAVLSNSKVIGAHFAGDDRVVSASESGAVVVWNITTNENHIVSSLFQNSKASLTCMSVCPHATWLAAFGLKSGLIVIADLRKTGKVLYNLRGHSKEVVSLSWCPAPVNVYPSKPCNTVVEKKLLSDKSVEPDIEVSSLETSSSDLENKSNEAANRRKQSSPTKELNSQTEVIFENVKNAGGKVEKMERDVIVAMAKGVSMDKLDKKSTTKPEANVRECKVSIDDLLKQKEDAVAKGEESTQDIEKETSKHSKSSEPNESDHFSSASECEDGLSCFKKPEVTEVSEEAQKGGNFSDDVFHDAQNVSIGETDKRISEMDKGSAEVAESKKAGNESGENWRTTPEDPSEGENWRKEPPAGVDEEPRKEFLLASSAKEANIYIWRAGTDGRMQSFITLPKPKPGRNDKKKSSSHSENPWIVVCWVSANLLLSSSRSAELLAWTLPKPLDSEVFKRLIHRLHWSTLFSIKAPIVYTNEFNFQQPRALNNVWTTGMDRNVISSDLGKLGVISSYAALGGSVSCLVGSPLDPNRCAIGSGEGVISLWDLGKANPKNIQFSTFYQKICGSVTALAWHPSNETSLAFGTTEGRIGIFDVTNKAKQPKLLNFFQTQIFKLEWGPIDKTTDKRSLFAVCERKVAIFDPASNQKEPDLLELPDNTSVYTMAWKPDYSMLLVSSKSGTLITYSTDLKITNISYLSHKLESILWHPEAASQVSPEEDYLYSNTFVSIVKFNELMVFNLNIKSENPADKSIVHIKNRGIKINSVAWSPHTSKLLVFVDDEGVAQVFDIESKTIISTYLNPCLDPLLSVHWSPVDSDYVIVGTMNHRINIWQVSEYLALNNAELNSQRNVIVKAQQKEASDLVTKTKQQETAAAPAVEAPKSKSQNKSQIVPLFYSVREKTQIEDITKLLMWKQGDSSLEASVGDGNQVDVLDVFGDTDQGHMEKVFKVNLAAFKQQGKLQQANLLSLFQGDIASSVKLAIERKCVNPWIISVAPMVSPKLWLSACETYAEQLMEQSDEDPMEVVTYLLVCHKVQEAVEFLCEQQLYREALVLAKGRFGKDSPMVVDILDKWAKCNVYQGNFELAACCFISLKKYEDAASVLFRRTSPDILEVAAKLAGLSGNEELLKAVEFRLKAFQGEKVWKLEEAHGSSNGDINVNSEGVTEDKEEESPEQILVKDGEESPVKVESTENTKEESKLIPKEDTQIAEVKDETVVQITAAVEEKGLHEDSSGTLKRKEESAEEPSKKG